MIAVLADDFSGAAELAGLGASHGLQTELWVGCEELPEPAVDLIAIDCGSRSLDLTAARRRTAGIARRLVAFHPSHLYKKTDSVLRGHVAEECVAIAEACGRSKVILVPANPSRRRCIIGGRYLIEDRPLHESSFGTDPEFPIRTSDVHALLDNRTGGPIEIPDIASRDDISAVVAELDESILPAGAADFFQELLHHLGCVEALQEPPTLGDAALLVSGSQAAWCGGLPARCAEAGLPLFTAPAEPEDLPAVLAIGDGDGSPPRTLLDRLVSAAHRVIDRLAPAVLLLEGGETAGALCQPLGWNRFAVSGAGSSGVGILTPLPARHPTLLVKPGSYPWPDWVFHQATRHPSLAPSPGQTQQP